MKRHLSCMDSLRDLARLLENHPAVVEKARIHDIYEVARSSSGGVALGDDAAAIVQPDGSHLLFAAEGMLESFLRDDPWFAGYSAVMVNLSDIASMGGEPLAVTDVLGSISDEFSDAVWEGMRAASKAYAVPIVGGHTTHTEAPSLAVSVLGKAGRNLLTSFDALAGDRLIHIVDLRGAYRGDKPFWNASTSSSPEALREGLALFPKLAASGWCRAAKDVSNGGIIGTLAMFCQCSGVGVEIDLDRLPIPDGVPMERWLLSFPSYGYLLAVAEDHVDEVAGLFSAGGYACGDAGHFRQDSGLSIFRDGVSLRLGFDF
jgi:AIR synthase-related protein